LGARVEPIDSRVDRSVLGLVGTVGVAEGRGVVEIGDRLASLIERPTDGVVDKRLAHASK